MKNILKTTIILMLITITIISIFIIIDINTKQNKVYAASSGSTSDLQLMARAINGEARGEPYEGQVAVRCCYTK